MLPVLCLVVVISLVCFKNLLGLVLSLAQYCYAAWRLQTRLESFRVFLVALGIGEQVDSGEKKKFSLKTHIANVRYRDWTYSRCETRKPYFHLPSQSSCSPYFRVVLVELGLIEGFSEIWRTQTFRSIQRRLLIQVSFNSHNAHCYFSHALHIYFVQQELCKFYNSLLCTYCT